MISMIKKLLSLCLIAAIVFSFVTMGCRKDPKATATAAVKTSSKATTGTGVKATTPKSSTSTAVSTLTQTDGSQTDGTTNPDIEIPVDGNENDSDGIDESNGTIQDGIFAGLKFSPEGMDLGGKKVVIKMWNPALAKVPGTSEIIDKQIRQEEKAMELFNCTIEWSYQNGHPQRLSDMLGSLLSGVKYADMWFYSVGTYMIPLYNAMIPVHLKPLDPYIDFNHPKWIRMGGAAKWVDGNRYGIPTVWDTVAPPATIYNPTLLAKAAVPDPMELALKGQWDWESFLQVATYCTLDIDGDGILDQFGVGANWDLVDFLLMSNGSSGIVMGEGRLISQYNEPRAIRSLDFYRNLIYSYKVTDYGRGSMFDNFRNRKLAMFLREVWIIGNQLNNRGMYDYKVAPLPKGPDMTDLTGHPFYLTDTRFLSIPENPDFTTEQMLAVWLYMNATDDPTDSTTYIDPFDSFITGGSSAFATQSRDVQEFWYNAIYQKDPKYNGLSYNLADGAIYNFVVGTLYPKIAAGGSVGAELEAIRAPLEQYLLNVTK